MRIGLDVRLTYYTHGGIAKYMRQLAVQVPLLDSGPSHVHFYRRAAPVTFSRRAQRVECWTPAHHPWETFALGVELAPHRLDVFHSPDFIPPRWGYRRSVVTVHDLAFLHYPQFLTEESRAYYNAQIRYAVRRADAIAAVSEATKSDLVNLLGVSPDKITVTHEGVDPEFQPLSEAATQAVLAQLRLSPGYLLFVGTFEPRKNVPGLLHAYARLRAQRPDAPLLVLVGNRGWLFAEAMRLARELGLEQHLRFFENFPDADLPAIYNGAGVTVLPSHYEGFGFPVLEAMACGVPAVVANRSALPEVAGEAALTVNPDDAEELACAIGRALEDSALRADLRQKGLERARQFSWPRTARETLALYKRIAQM
jgi:glycosyltransferase involved in cell wall biosynthesis